MEKNYQQQLRELQMKLQQLSNALPMLGSDVELAMYREAISDVRKEIASVKMRVVYARIQQNVIQVDEESAMDCGR